MNKPVLNWLNSDYTVALPRIYHGPDPLLAPHDVLDWRTLRDLSASLYSVNLAGSRAAHGNDGQPVVGFIQKFNRFFSPSFTSGQLCKNNSKEVAKVTDNQIR